MTPASSCLWPGTLSRTPVLLSSVLFVRVVSGRALPPSSVQFAVWSAIDSVVVVGWAGSRRMLGDGTVLIAWEALFRMLALWMLLFRREVLGRPM